MLVVVTRSGAPDSVHVLLAEEGEGGEAEAAVEEQPPNPILPVGGELLWTAIAFFLAVIVMHFWAVPRVTKGMKARNDRISGDLEAAESIRAAMLQEQADYDAKIAAARVEASKVLDEARAEVEQDRQRKLAAANVRIGEAREAAMAESEAARAAAMGQVEAAVAEVAADIAGRVLGRPVTAAELAPTVRQTVNTGVTS